MSYNRTQWVSGETPLSAQNFNNMEDGIEENKEAISSLIDSVGDEWNQSTTYKAGDYVIYYNTLWECLVDNTGQTPQEGTYWTKRKLADMYSELNSKFEYKTVSGRLPSSTNYTKIADYPDGFNNTNSFIVSNAVAFDGDNGNVYYDYENISVIRGNANGICVTAKNDCATGNGMIFISLLKVE